MVSAFAVLQLIFLSLLTVLGFLGSCLARGGTIPSKSTGLGCLACSLLSVLW